MNPHDFSYPLDELDKLGPLGSQVFSRLYGIQKPVNISQDQLSHVVGLLRESQPPSLKQKQALKMEPSPDEWSESLKQARTLLLKYNGSAPPLSVIHRWSGEVAARLWYLNRRASDPKA